MTTRPATTSLGRFLEIALLAVIAAVAGSTLGCGTDSAAAAHPDDVAAEITTEAATAATADETATSATSAIAAVPLPPGDPDRGRELARHYECNRCHDGLDIGSIPLEKHCYHCHQDILADKFKAARGEVAKKWKAHVGYARDVPSLENAGMRFSATWLERFLLNPYDLRPRLRTSMPRLAVTPAEARDIAAYVTKDKLDSEEPSLAGADLAVGRQLMETKGCGACHSFSGVDPLPEAPPDLPSDDPYAFEDRQPVALAPDLSHARERLGPREVINWVRNPQKVKHDTPMPQIELTDDELRQIAAYVLTAPLRPAAARTVPERLPVLERKVTYQEISDRVLGTTCRHCHSDPDIARGDGGAGNTGGFGFRPRGVNLRDYASTAAGRLDDEGQRQSLFAPLADGTPRLLAALLARQAEEIGQLRPDVRGMPLGLPALSAEDIQLVETWIAQGRPR